MFRSYDHHQAEIYTTEINTTDNVSVFVFIQLNSTLSTFTAHLCTKCILDVRNIFGGGKFDLE
jgi:hypothetical protein